MIIITQLSGCEIKEMEFDKSKWNERFDGFYEYRENMVQDLMENHLEKGMEFKKVIELLGEPGNYQNKKENEITYEIMVDYGWNIDPMEGKELYIEFDKDSTVFSCVPFCDNSDIALQYPQFSFYVRLSFR